MTLPREFCAFLASSAMIVVFHCNAERLPPPTHLTYEWLDQFTVNMSWSWQRPSNLPENCEIKFCLDGKRPHEEGHGCVKKDSRYFTENCLTEEMDSDFCTYTIHTTGCDGWNDSTSVNVSTRSSKPRAEVVKNFTCILEPNGMNCSWIPVNRSLNLMLSYRACGISKELRKSLKECDQPYSSEIRNGCYLKANGGEHPVCILASTEIGQSTFKAPFAIPPTKLNIIEDKGYLKLSWKRPAVGENCQWIYEFCYTKCDKPRQCQNVTGKSHSVPYNKNCLYKFQSRVLNGNNCPEMFSEWSENTYGTNKPDGTLTVVAIIIPIILCVCVLLSCYCFRKHSDIICPRIPDPSVIFKEMMMNGNKEIKTTTGRLYMPVPEPIDPCRINVMS